MLTFIHCLTSYSWSLISSHLLSTFMFFIYVLPPVFNQFSELHKYWLPLQYLPLHKSQNPFPHSAHVAQFHISLLKGRGESFLDKSCFPSLLPSSLFPITATLLKKQPVFTASLSFPFNRSSACPLAIQPQIL